MPDEYTFTSNKAKAILLDLGGVVFAASGCDSTVIDWRVVGELNERYDYALNIGENRFGEIFTDYNGRTSQFPRWNHLPTGTIRHATDQSGAD